MIVPFGGKVDYMEQAKALKIINGKRYIGKNQNQTRVIESMAAWGWILIITDNS